MDGITQSMGLLSLGCLASVANQTVFLAHCRATVSANSAVVRIGFRVASTLADGRGLSWRCRCGLTGHFGRVSKVEGLGMSTGADHGAESSQPSTILATVGISWCWHRRRCRSWRHAGRIWRRQRQAAHQPRVAPPSSAPAASAASGAGATATKPPAASTAPSSSASGAPAASAAGIRCASRLWCTGGDSDTGPDADGDRGDSARQVEREGDRQIPVHPEPGLPSGPQCVPPRGDHGVLQGAGLGPRHLLRLRFHWQRRSADDADRRRAGGQSARCLLPRHRRPAVPVAERASSR